MKPKILFIMNMPPPIHGAAIVGRNIYESKLINKEFECVYINLSASNKVSEIGKLKFNKVIFLFKNLWNIYKTIRKEKPQLCYVTPSSWDWGFYRDFIMVILLKSLKCKIVAHFHNKGVLSWEKRFYNKILYKAFFNNVKVILLAKELYEEKKAYVNQSSLFICPNGIPKTINKVERKVNKKTSFLFLSNMMEEKGVYILLDACKILRERGYFFSCDLVGNWSDITEFDLKDRISNYLLDNIVNYHGPQYGLAKKTFFEKANVFVFPTYYHGETFGLVLLEAMEYALPCISTNEGGIPSVVKDGETGFLIKPKDPVELVDRMALFIENKELQLKMGKAGRERFLNNFTMEIFEKNFISILKKCLQ